MPVPSFRKLRTARVMADLTGAVVLIVHTEDLIYHLQKVFIILMDAERCWSIGLKSVLQKQFDAKGMEKFLYHQKPSIGEKFPSVKIYNKLPIASQLDIF